MCCLKDLQHADFNGNDELLVYYIPYIKRIYSSLRYARIFAYVLSVWLNSMPTSTRIVRLLVYYIPYIKHTTPRCFAYVLSAWPNKHANFDRDMQITCVLYTIHQAHHTLLFCELDCSMYRLVHPIVLPTWSGYRVLLISLLVIITSWMISSLLKASMDFTWLLANWCRCEFFFS